jgi:hypothetical protein
LLVFNLLNKLIIIVVCYFISLTGWAASDPTQPLFGLKSIATTKKYSPLVLQSVIKSNDDYKVVINGKLLSQGDSVLGYTINKINTGTAVLISKEKRLVLSLFAAGKRLVKVNN